jgi:acyl-coenzyme A thioesterase PaaI-like protein
MTQSVSELSIQESLYPDLTCFGCGHANPDGFHLRSYREDDHAVATFTPRSEHDNGFGFLNGGIFTTVLDCHTAAVVMWEADQRGWEAETGAPVPFITASLEVKFLRPTPLGPALSSHAEPGSVSESEIVINAELVYDEMQRAMVRAQ